jgi:hypothetical protein
MTRVTLLVLALVGASVVPALVRGNDAAPTSTTVPAVTLVQRTTSEGALPNLDGRWLLLTSVSIGTGPKRTLVSVLEGTRVDGKQHLVERHVLLPKAQREALERANDARAGVWEPTPADLDAIAASFDRLEPEDRGIAEIDHILTGRDAYDEELQEDAITKDALWVYRQRYVFQPGGNRPLNQGNLLAALRDEHGVHDGTYVALAVAASIVPVPIRFDGAFRMIPLGSATRSVWARLGDFFAGCN